MGLWKDVVVYTCEMWHQKKSVAEIIEELSREYRINFTERDVVDTLIEYYQAIFEEESQQPQKDKNIGADFKAGDMIVFRRDADGVKMGTIGQVNNIYEGWLQVYVQNIHKVIAYWIDNPVPFEKLNLSRRGMKGK